MSIIEVLAIIILIILVGPTIVGFFHTLILMHKSKRRH